MIGQFIQLDENRGDAGNIESQNRYAYALNNPNKYIDKNGRAAMMSDGGSSGGIGGLIGAAGKLVKDIATKSVKKNQSTSQMTSQDRYNLWMGHDSWDNYGGKPKGVYATQADYNKAHPQKASGTIVNKATDPKASTMSTTRETPLILPKCNKETMEILNYFTNVSKGFVDHGNAFIDHVANQAQKFIDDPAQFIAEAWDGLIATVTSPRFWFQTMISLGLACATGGQSLWLQAIAAGTGFTVGGEAADYANADFDNEKFLELKGVDSGGEYLGGLIFDSALSSGSVYAGSKAFEYVKGFMITKPSKPYQLHHFASNKNKTYTPQFEAIVKKYKLDLDGDWNKKMLPHEGRHPNEYHDYILDNMKIYDNIAQGNRDIFLRLYEDLKKNVTKNPDMLYKDFWNKK